MFGKLLLLFILVPLVDLMVLIRVGEVLTLWPTIGLVIVTGAIGAALARWQGLRTLAAIQMELAAGRMPTDRLADGAMILTAGAVLITPGFLTDALGLLLLLPPVRSLLKRGMTRYLNHRLRVETYAMGPDGQMRSVGSRAGTASSDEGPSDEGPAQWVETGTPGERPMRYVKNEASDASATSNGAQENAGQHD